MAGLPPPGGGEGLGGVGGWGRGGVGVAAGGGVGTGGWGRGGVGVGAGGWGGVGGLPQVGGLPDPPGVPMGLRSQPNSTNNKKRTEHNHRIPDRCLSCNVFMALPFVPAENFGAPVIS